MMATNLALDDSLIAEAVKAGNHKTKKEAVTIALQEYIRLKKRQGMHDLIGKVEYYDDIDHEARRRQPRKAAR